MKGGTYSEETRESLDPDEEAYDFADFGLFDC
jgi:hypothetical protein